jgi:choline kinase
MADLHSVDIAAVELSDGTSEGYEIGARRNVLSWLEPAEAVLRLRNIPEATWLEFDLPRFKKEWELYMQQLAAVDDIHGMSRRVFAHNDTQYGNLLRLKKLKEGTLDHEQVSPPTSLLVGIVDKLLPFQIIVVDFEYASPNPATFDIANHFHEWAANYHGATPHLLDSSRYPTGEQRRNFYTAYLNQSGLPADEDTLQRLERQVKVWSPASHAMWAVWGLVQAREDVEGGVVEPEFDYIGYSKGRIQGFRREIGELRKQGLLG